MSTCAEQNSGGPGGALIKELADHSKASHGAGIEPTIECDFFSKLSSLSWGTDVRFPYLKTAMLEAQLASPANKIKSSVLGLLAPCNLADLNRKTGEMTLNGAGRQ